jgi:hypothetical protein
MLSELGSVILGLMVQGKVVTESARSRQWRGLRGSPALHWPLKRNGPGAGGCWVRPRSGREDAMNKVFLLVEDHPTGEKMLGLLRLLLDGPLPGRRSTS